MGMNFFFFTRNQDEPASHEGSHVSATFSINE